jgi:iduronate 2-sulfatase
VALPDNMFDPEGIPGIAMHNHPELRVYTDIPEGNAPIPDDFARTLIRGYRASVSYTDAQIGLLLDALDRTGLKDQTIILLWGDHGWHLGDNNLWGKESLFERALRVPLIVVDPRIPGGHRTDALVELVDVYPTLAELAGLALPAHLEGTSMAPLLRAPDAPWKEAVFSCFIRPDRDKSGWTVRDDRYRYAEWKDAQGDRLQRVLFDLHRDPLENRNLAGDPESQPVIERMHRLLHGGWQPHQRPLVP